MRLLFLLAAVLLSACGNDTAGSGSTSEVSATETSGASHATCRSMVGQTMTADFAGCETGGLLVEMTKTECSDGRVLIAPDLARTQALTEKQIAEAVWGFVGQPTQADAGDGKLHAAASVDCLDF